MLKPKINKIRLHKQVKNYLQQSSNNDYTNPEIQKNIASYGVYVDGEKVTNRLAWVYPHQQISVDWPKRDHGNLEGIRIIEEAQDYLILYKPPGVVVHAGNGHQKDNIVEWLLANTSSQEKFDPLRYPTRGLVHRLDKLTQGLVLIAKNEEALIFFQRQFRNRTVKKEYLALLVGQDDRAYHIKNFQVRSRSKPTKNKLFWSRQEARGYDSKARFAESYFTPLYISRELNQTIYKVEIKTGRMHQIRLQAQALGHALVADPKYPQQKISIPKSAIQSHKVFEEGVYNESVRDLHHLEKQEFTELKQSLFGGTDFCLLSNYLKLLDPQGQELEFKYI